MRVAYLPSPEVFYSLFNLWAKRFQIFEKKSLFRGFSFDRRKRAQVVYISLYKKNCFIIETSP